MNDTVAPPAVEGRAPSGLSNAERLLFARRRYALPLALFAAIAAVYCGLFVLILWPPVWAGAMLSPVLGLVIAMLFVVGHDACHLSFTPSRILNELIGRIAFLPSVHSFSIWDHGHNRMHHRYNNVRGEDKVWEPMSPEDYRAAGPARRAFYRFYRSPYGVGFYYMIELWARYHLMIPPSVHRHLRPVYFTDSVLVLAGFAAQIWAAIALGAAFGHGPLASVLTAIAIPFLVWNGLMSVTVFLHHTNPLVRWYATVAAWRADRGAIAGAVRVRFPGIFGPLSLAIMEHNAHHSAPGVPLYNLPRMQDALAARETLPSMDFSVRALARLCSRCKLYDYERDRWVTFAKAG